MLDALSRALADVKRQVPTQILNEAFKSYLPFNRSKLTSIDNEITNNVIRPRVMMDCSLLGGQEVRIPLTEAEYEMVDATTQIYRFPKELTNNRTIISALAVEFYNPYMMSWLPQPDNMCQSPLTLQMGKQMIDAYTPQPKTFNGRITMVGENTILLQGFNLPTSNYVLRCLLEYDDYMSGLNPRHYRYFARLCILAVKAYCYHALFIETGEAEIRAGRELGKWMQILEGYSDCEDQYQELLEKWPKLAMLSDDESMSHFYRQMVRGF